MGDSVPRLGSSSSILWVEEPGIRDLYEAPWLLSDLTNMLPGVAKMARP